MARSRITDTSIDLQKDSGTILQSLIMGEQQDWMVTLNFVQNIYIGYNCEAVVVEADNDDSGEIPRYHKQNGVQTKLNIRLPKYRGEWSASQPYFREEVVRYGDLYFILINTLRNEEYRSTKPPVTDVDRWMWYVPNKIYVEFPSTLGVSPRYAKQPQVDKPVYGFFELRVTEPIGGTFRKTWKPIRGVIQLRFSPTERVSGVL